MPPAGRSQGKEKGGGEGKNSEGQRQREKMNETMGALELEKSEVLAKGTPSAQAGQSGKRLSSGHALAQRHRHVSGSVWEGSR